MEVGGGKPRPNQNGLLKCLETCSWLRARASKVRGLSRRKMGVSPILIRQKMPEALWSRGAKESMCKYWATRSSNRLFARSLTRSLTNSRAHGSVIQCWDIRLFWTIVDERALGCSDPLWISVPPILIRPKMPENESGAKNEGRKQSSYHENKMEKVYTFNRRGKQSETKYKHEWNGGERKKE